MLTQWAKVRMATATQLVLKALTPQPTVLNLAVPRAAKAAAHLKATLLAVSPAAALAHLQRSTTCNLT